MYRPAHIGSHQCSRAAHSLVAVAMLLVGLSGTGKLLDLPSFRSSLLTWERLPDWVIDVGWFGVPTIEATAALLWFAGSWRRTCERVVMGLLASIFAVVSVHLAAGASPSCNCFGVFMNQLAFMAEGRWLLGKVAVLLGSLMVGHIVIVLTSGLRSGGPAPVDRRVSAGRRTARAYTLVEVLITVTVTGLLLALTIGGLSAARNRALLALTLGRLQQHGAVLAAYASDWRDQYPALVDAASSPYHLSASGETLVLPTYFALHGSWHMGLFDMYYAGQSPEIFYDAGTGASERRYTFVMSCTLFAAPDFWSLETRQSGVSQLRPPMQSDTAFPSNKSTVLSIQPFMSRLASPDNLVPNPRTLTAGVPTAAADGHAESRSARRFQPGLQLGEMTTSPPGITFHQTDLFVGLHTARGVRGTDWK